MTPQGEYLPARDEENRRLAEFVGCEFRMARLPDDFPKTAILFWFMPNGDFVGENPPDFYADEAANALLLEKLFDQLPGRSFIFSCWTSGPKKVVLRIVFEDEGRIIPSSIIYSCEDDRKTAIVKVALAYLEAQHAT